MKGHRNPIVWLLASILAVMLILPACGSAGSGSGSGGTGGGNEAQTTQPPQQETAAQQANEPAPASEEPVEVTIMSHFLTPTPPQKDNPVEQEIERLTNTKLDIQWVSGNNYTDKFNVTIASGAIPDLIFVNDPFGSVFRTAAAQGAFWDVGPYIQDYPNLVEKIDPIAWELTKMDGKNYGIPRPRPAEADTFFILRKDWLDHVGLDVPTTSEELYHVLKAFTEQDPDGNGKHDTIGYAAYVNPTDMGSLGRMEQIFTKANGEWKLQDDGQLVYTALLPEMREALEFMNRLYAEKLIPVDFASIKLSQTKEMFQAGQAGMINEKAGAMQQYYDSLVKLDPDFDFMSLMPVTSINGYNPKGPGFAAMNAIPKSVPEDKMKRILAMINRWMDDDVFILHKQGIEGVHHRVENGEVIIDTEKMRADSVESYNQIVYVANPYDSSVKPTFPEEVQTLYAEIQDERAKTSVADVSIGLYSETAITYLPELQKKIQDLKTKVIMGREPLEAWDQFVAGLKEDPNMVKMTEEINAAYQSRQQ